MVKEGYKETEIGVVPTDWKVNKLGNLGKFKNGINKGKEFFGKGDKIINFTDVFRNSKLYENLINGKVEANDLEKDNL